MTPALSRTGNRKQGADNASLLIPGLEEPRFGKRANYRFWRSRDLMKSYSGSHCPPIAP